MATKKVASEKVEPIKTARTLLLYVHDGSASELKVTLPAGARVTFGPAVPYKTKDGYPATKEGYSLRIYENTKADSLIACFSNVTSFRDITIPVERLIVREAGKTVWKSDETGYSVSTEVKRSQSSVDTFKLLNEATIEDDSF